MEKQKSVYSSDSWAITFILTRKGGERFDRVAKKLYNQTPRGLTAIILDGKIISKPVVNAEKFGGSGVITGNFTKSEAVDLVEALKRKPLPCSLKFWSTKYIQPAD